MSNESLYAISPIDGRYASKTKSLSKYFSEAALIQYRVRIEVEYFIHLISLLNKNKSSFSNDDLQKLRNIYLNINNDDIKRVKEIESRINHDVKAVEYFVKEKLDNLGFSEDREFVHFALTSQDINNTSIPLMLKEAHFDIIMPKLKELVDKINSLANDNYSQAMLARTHGQVATPTRLGREFKVFSYRLEEQIARLGTIKFSAKFGGATGGLNAHIVSFPDIDWVEFANNFLDSIGLIREQFTTQISNYDNLAAYFDNIRRIAIILIDMSRDIWQYISMEYFTQKVKDEEVGSSAMPHKVNPIDFENAEGNLSIAVSYLSFLSDKLPISRLQRDLTDSTVIRNIGMPLAHILIAFDNLLKGLNKINVNKAKIDEDLDNNQVVVAEAIQSILRKEGYDSPYEALKKLTRGKQNIRIEDIHSFIDTLDVNDELKNRLKQINAHNYIGI